jgi:hypothetical protein
LVPDANGIANVVLSLLRKDFDHFVIHFHKQSAEAPVFVYVSLSGRKRDFHKSSFRGRRNPGGMIAPAIILTWLAKEPISGRLRGKFF